MLRGNGRLPHATEADALPCEIEEHRGFQLLFFGAGFISRKLIGQHFSRIRQVIADC